MEEATMRNTVLLLLALGAPAPFRGLASQATNPPYLSEMPPVERVLKEIKGTTPDETAARQMGTFLQFKAMIEQMSGYRQYRNELTADEQRLIARYYGAYWNIAKTNPEYRKFTGLKGYDISSDYRMELFEKYFSPAFRAKYEEVDATFKRNMAARARADTESMLRARAEIAEFEQKGNKLAEEQRALRRCMEAGLSEPQCVSEGIGKSFKDTFLGGMDLPFLSTPKVTGLRMGGAFPKAGTGSAGLTFYAEQVVVNCQDLAPAAYQYSVAVRDGQGVITIQLEPRPLVLTVRPDGRLSGPAAVDISGQVQVGTQMGTRTWSDGRTEPISRPVYEPRTRRCGAALLTSSGPSPDPVTMNTAGTMIVGLFMGPGGNTPPKPSEPGLRLAGEYGTQAGFDLEFRAEGVIVGCREAAILRQYKVAASASGVLLTVQHGAAPFTMTVGSDGRLSGSGTVRVDGRQVSDVVNGRVTYVPRSASCAVGVLAPAGAGGGAVAGGGAASGAAPPSPAAAAGKATLLLTATAPTAGGPLPAVQEFFALLDEEAGKVLTEGGFRAAPGKSLFGTLVACSGPDANCVKAMQAIAAHTIARAQTDDEGKASFSGVAPGAYYLMAIAADYGPQPLLWNLKVELKAGQNTLVLTPKNVTPIP
jgi:hypothetical protein